MAQTDKENVLEKIMYKLRENTSDSGDSLHSETLEPLSNKIDNLIQNVQGCLENIRKVHTYHRNAAVRAKKDYDTYVYILEALYNEYNNVDSDSEPVKIVKKENNNAASEPVKIVKKENGERKMPHQGQTSQPQLQQPQLQQPQKIKEGDVTVKTVPEEKPKEKSGRFKFSFP